MNRDHFTYRTGLKIGFLTLAVSLLPCPAAHAQSKDLALGVAAGATSGIGLHLRFQANPRWSLGLTGMPMLWRGRRGASVGLQGMWTFWRRGPLQSYAFLGSHYYGYRHVRPLSPRNYQSLVVGGGLGIQANAGPFGFIFELPLSQVIALHPDTHLRFPGRVNFGMFPNFAVCFYLGRSRRKNS